MSAADGHFPTLVTNISANEKLNLINLFLHSHSFMKSVVIKNLALSTFVCCC
jgi:hypothetical protein